MLAWDALGELDTYRITQIPRRADPGPAQPPSAESDDAGRTQRLAALVAAYHAGAAAGGGGPAALAIGWVRHDTDGPVQLLAAGQGRAAPVRSLGLADVPAGDRARRPGLRGATRQRGEQPARLAVRLPARVRAVSAARSGPLALGRQRRRDPRPAILSLGRGLPGGPGPGGPGPGGLSKPVPAA